MSTNYRLELFLTPASPFGDVASTSWGPPNNELGHVLVVVLDSDVVTDRGAGIVQVLGRTQARSRPQTALEQRTHPALELYRKPVNVELLVVESAIVCHGRASVSVLSIGQRRISVA